MYSLIYISFIDLSYLCIHLFILIVHKYGGQVYMDGANMNAQGELLASLCLNNHMNSDN